MVWEEKSRHWWLYRGKLKNEWVASYRPTSIYTCQNHLSVDDVVWMSGPRYILALFHCYITISSTHPSVRKTICADRSSVEIVWSRLRSQFAADPVGREAGRRPARPEESRTIYDGLYIRIRQPETEKKKIENRKRTGRQLSQSSWQMKHVGWKFALWLPDELCPINNRNCIRWNGISFGFSFFKFH